MKIGIISDTHDNLINLEKIVKIFNEDLKIDFLIHCGDVCSPFAVNILNRLNCEYFGVFGNNDGEILGIQKLSNWRFSKPPILKTINNKKIIIFHEGNIVEFIDESIDYVLFGHTHTPMLKFKGEQTILNPGSLSGYVTKNSTYAIIDLLENKTEILTLESGE
jgi:putative phosphoesterase